MSDLKNKNVISTEAEYQAAVAEFSRLWDSPGSTQDQRHMEHLLGLIEAYEEASGNAG